MCTGSPDVPEPEQKEPQQNQLLIGDEEEDQMIQDSQRRGTQGLQIALNSGASGGSGNSSGLTV